MEIYKICREYQPGAEFYDGSVDPENVRLCSGFAQGRHVVEYRLGERTYAKLSVTPLMAFESLAVARAYLEYREDKAIYFGEGKASPDCMWRSHVFFANYLDRYSDRQLIHWWNTGVCPYVHDRVQLTPRGTVFCDWIKLTERIE